jgi:hypothetical protein
MSSFSIHIDTNKERTMRHFYKRTDCIRTASGEVITDLCPQSGDLIAVIGPRVFPLPPESATETGTLPAGWRWATDDDWAQAQAHGLIRPATEQEAWEWAMKNQGFTGDFEAWCAMEPHIRAQYETGAAGIGTI